MRHRAPTSRTAPTTWRPVRSATDRVVAGVAGGLADQLGVDPIVVRLAFVVLALAGGAGIALYAVGWVFGVEAPTGAAAGSGSRARMRRTRSELERVVAVALVVVGSLLLLRAARVWFGDALVWPVALAATGSALIWARTDATGRARITRMATRLPREAIAGTRVGRAPVLRMILGGALVVAGMAGLLAANDALFAARVARSVAFAVLVTAAGLGLILGPWMWRTLRQLSEERRERIRSEERAEVAAHLHDSVLQTLAMIQRAGSPQEMASLARGQERELRTWLYGRGRADLNGGRSLSGALDQVASRVERQHHVPVETVVVGDAPMDDRLRALVDAAGEAMTNAARHSGAASVSVYAEVGRDAVHLYVRDEGKGFDPRVVSADRHGIRESIVGRMERGGGVATITSEPAEGTEVHLRISRASS